MATSPSETESSGYEEQATRLLDTYLARHTSRDDRVRDRQTTKAGMISRKSRRAKLLRETAAARGRSMRMTDFSYATGWKPGSVEMNGT